MIEKPIPVRKKNKPDHHMLTLQTAKPRNKKDAREQMTSNL